MWMSTSILGSTTTKALTERASAPVLIIGRDQFTRQHLASVGCYNFLAAAALSRVVRDLGVRDTDDLFKRFAPTDLILPHIGPVALAVVGAAFAFEEIGGDSPLEAWVRAHRAKGHDPDDFVTFDTMKKAAAKRERGTGAADRRRRDTAATRQRPTRHPRRVTTRRA